MSVTREAWLAAVGEVAPVPECHDEALTVTELAELLGLRRSAMKERMPALIKAGKARRVSKRVYDVMGRPQVVPAYLLIQETPDVQPVARSGHSRRREHRGSRA